MKLFVFNTYFNMVKAVLNDNDNDYAGAHE